MAMNQERQEEVLQAWSESAPYWEKHRDAVKQMFDPITRALIEDARITEGRIILDVAGGAGEPSLTIAEVVGPHGSVMCTDPIQEMVLSAEREAQKREFSNMRFMRCSAESLPFEDDSFDGAVCRLGIMFFTDPVAGASEMLRVIKPGGRISFAVWRKPEVNPFFRIVSDLMSRYVEPVEEDPDAPGAFRFAEPGALAGVLKRASAILEKDRTLYFMIEPQIALEEFWSLRVELSDTLRKKVASLSAEQSAAVEREAREAAREFFTDGRMRFPAQVQIVTASKPLSANADI